MNKQEAIEKIRNISTLKINDRVSHHQIDMVIKNQVLDIISQINELDKVVVPKFVAEYIEYCKHEKFYALHGAYANMDDRLKCWRFKGNNSELFAKAWLYGYEVEKEELYTVRFKFLEDNGYNYLVKLTDTDRFFIGGLVCDVKDAGHRQAFFTKEELSERGLWGNPLIVIKNINGEVQE